MPTAKSEETGEEADDVKYTWSAVPSVSYLFALLKPNQSPCFHVGQVAFKVVTKLWIGTGSLLLLQASLRQRDHCFQLSECHTFILQKDQSCRFPMVEPTGN